MFKINERIICCMLTAIMFFVGMCLEICETDSSFSYKDSMHLEEIVSCENYVVEDVEACTLDMLNQGFVSARSITVNSMSRWQSKAILLFLIVGEFLQYLFYYQSEECKEDGQLLLCRTVAVKYIHQMDGQK